MSNSTDRKISQKPGQVNQRFRWEWIIASVLIGIIAIPASIFLIYIIESYLSFLFGLPCSVPIPGLLLLIIVILSALYIHMRKMKNVFILKVSATAIAVSLIVVAIMLGPYLLPRITSEPTLWINKLDYEPQHYVEITPEELEDLPTLQGLNNKVTYGHNELKTTNKEKNRIVDLIEQKKETEQVHTFDMWVSAKVWLPDEIPTMTAYTNIEITAEELKRFQTIKKAMDKPEMWHGISSDEWDGFLEFTQGYDEQKGVLIEFKDKLYQIKNNQNFSPDIKNAESYIKVEGEYYTFKVGLIG